MFRHILILTSILLTSAVMLADDELPIIEVKADRTMIYPQRMELTGEESLMDILQMFPDLMVGGYEDVLSGFNLRIDNCPINGDTKLIISQMKAKDIAQIQVCDNAGVAKGAVGMNKVLDINMKMPDKLKGFVEGQGGFGKEMAGISTVNALYGSKKTDLYANASYRHQSGDSEYLSLHMTNRFGKKDRLLTYFTQQYLNILSIPSRKVMGRARYFHTFNDQGTELLILGGYQYASDPILSNKLPQYTLELNTPLFGKRLSMTFGLEGNYLMTSEKNKTRSWNAFNNDVYLQLTWSLPKWRITIGNRLIIFNYKVMENALIQKFTDIRDNANACVIYNPNKHHQIQLGYYRKYYDPIYTAIFMENVTFSEVEWAIKQGELEASDINQIKLAYAHSRRRLTVQAEASYYTIEEGENFTELNTSVYWKTNRISLAGGSNLYLAKSGTYASFRFAPTAYLPHDWQIGLQAIYFTVNSPRRVLTGVPVYGCLSVNKQFGKKWNLGIDWHDMIDALCSDGLVNRHAANIKLQYRF